ncbi:MAG: formylglycine-generating enzyme family protein [Candidatus Hydrogenedentes bacterium]|nr:formylglycine-generating enzyme family protein [Candidatus Hydrogenedentota bacterium]
MKYLQLVICVLLVSIALVVTTGCPRRQLRAGDTREFDGMEFVWIPAGTFTMGSPESEVGSESDETQHEVTLSSGFWLGKYEVTQAQWESVMGSNPSTDVGPNKPVHYVGWDNAQSFISALNGSTDGSGGGVYGLPSEAQWEFAYRAGSSTRFYWGEDAAETEIDDYAWYYLNSNFKPHPVGNKLPNDWGLYDMAGNVFEWCADWYGDYPAGPIIDPSGAPSGSEWVIRGGSRMDYPDACRAANRDYSEDADGGSAIVGIRLMRTPD